MQNKIVSTVLAVFIMSFCVAQKQAKTPAHKRPVFHSYNTFNLLYNSQGLDAGFQSVNGFSIAGAFAGIGTGVDWYGIRSVPVFLDLRQAFRLGNARFFGYGNIGYNVAWPGNEDAHSNISSEYKSDGGIYYDLGLGYLIPFNRRNAMVISGGYSVKEMTERYGFSPCSWPGQCPTMSYEKYAYRFQRLSVKIGWRF